MSRGRTSCVLPIGYAEQVLELEIKLQDQQSLEAIQILCKMYKIGVDYYLQNDLKKASYLQKKLNALCLRSFQTKENDFPQSARKRVLKQLKEETQKLNCCQETYINTWVKQSQKSQKKIKDCLQADLEKQEERFQTRKLQRIKSSGKL